MLKRLISVLVVLGLASVGLGEEKTREQTERQNNQAARRLLGRVLPAANFTNVGFKDAIDFLRDVSGANIYVNWKELKKAGVDEQTSINVNVKDVKLEKLLNLMISDVAGKDAKVAWILDDGVIEISTTERIRGATYIRIYEVSDLIDARVPQRKGDVLMSIITECIAPTSWADVGGNGAIKFKDGKLVITQTAENHQAILNLLDGLREFRK